jgi:hypothetical protein
MESIVQPTYAWGTKEGRQVIWQRTPIHRIHLNRLESGTDP